MFAEIDDFFKKVRAELETKGTAELQALAADVRNAWASEKNDILNQITTASPDVQAAVQHALALAEQALAAALAAHGL
jgi:hypothetical protein